MPPLAPDRLARDNRRHHPRRRPRVATRRSTRSAEGTPLYSGGWSTSQSVFHLLCSCINSTFSFPRSPHSATTLQQSAVLIMLLYVVAGQPCSPREQHRAAPMRPRNLYMAPAHQGGPVLAQDNDACSPEALRVAPRRLFHRVAPAGPRRLLRLLRLLRRHVLPHAHVALVARLLLLHLHTQLACVVVLGVHRLPVATAPHRGALPICIGCGITYGFGIMAYGFGTRGAESGDTLREVRSSQSAACSFDAGF